MKPEHAIDLFNIISFVFSILLLMGILQKLMRKNPTLLVSTLAGFVVKGISDASEIIPKEILKIYSNTYKDNFSWKLSPEAVKELKIDEQIAMEEYGHLKDILV